MSKVVLKMNLDGSILVDNPNPKSYIFVEDLRNPFGSAWRPSDDLLYVSDNGPAVDDRIAKILPGENSGWPRSMRTNSMFIWWYTQGPTGIVIAANQFGSQHEDDLFGQAYFEGSSRGSWRWLSMLVTMSFI